MTGAVFVPPRRLASPRSPAEAKVLEWLARLPDGWTVLHSLGITNHPFKRWAEADVVLIGPPGLIVIEVKGGRVRRRDGLWEYIDRHGRATRSHEGPFDQAGGAHASLRRALIEAGTLDRRACSGYAVLLPDTHLEPVDRQVASVLLDAADRWGAPAPIVERWCRYWAGRTGQGRPLSADDRADLIGHLRGDLDLQPSLSLMAQRVDEELTRLTAEQRRIVRAATYNPRLFVHGRAGTGKTMLALDQARRFGADGARVLLTCRSPHLAVRLREAVHAPSVDVVAYESLTTGAVDVAEGAHPPYDVAVIDEAQDLDPSDVGRVLDRLLIGGVESGRWTIMHDPAQNLTDLGRSEPSRLRGLASTELRLSLNCRNTRQIAVAASVLTRIELDNEAPAMGPDVNMLWWSTDHEHDRLLATELGRIVAQVSPHRVAVLTREPLDVERIGRLERMAGVRLMSMDGSVGGDVVLATTHEFKGLESDVVVVADVAEMHDMQLRRHAYVACTRARTHLTIMLHESVRQDYNKGAAWFGRLLARRGGNGDER